MVVRFLKKNQTEVEYGIGSGFIENSDSISFHAN
jgi:hypothetical protein